MAMASAAGRAVALVLLACMGLAGPVAAQRPGCGLGTALDRLRDADRLLAQAPASLVAGRAAGAEASAGLQAAAATLAGCACHQAAADAAEAAGLAEQATAEAGAVRLRATLDRARFSARLARERLGRQGCS